MKKQVRQFTAWVIADGDYRAGPTRYAQLLIFGDRGGAADYIASMLRKDIAWEPVEVVCRRKRKRRSKKP